MGTFPPNRSNRSNCSNQQPSTPEKEFGIPALASGYRKVSSHEISYPLQIESTHTRAPTSS